MGTLKATRDARRQLPVNAAAGGWGGNLKVLALLASVLIMLVLVPPAAADPPRDGSGFGVSDDGIGNSLYGLGDGFERLRPKAFRFTVPYDAVDVPAETDRARAIINRVKEVGVSEILVSFRQRHDQWRPEKECLENPAGPCDFVRPTRAEWRTYVRRFMDVPNGSTADGRPKTIDDDVTMWSPANEPNAGTGWLKGDDARAKLAGYFLELKEELAGRASTDKVVSPEFHDHVDATGRPVRQPDAVCPNRDGNPSTVDSCSTVEIYIRKYRQAVQTAPGGGGGETAGFGDWLGWHPIDGARRRKVDSTTDFLDATASTANTPVVVTAAGFVRHPDGIIYPNEPEPSQTGTVKWFASSLARTARIKRIHYHNMRQDPSSPSDSGLIRRDESVRPAWRVWCGAGHADNPDHPDCLHSAGLWYVAQSVAGDDWQSLDDDRFDPPTLWAQNHGVGSTEQFLIPKTGLPASAGAYFQGEGCWRLASPAQGYVQPGFPGKFNDAVETACGKGLGSTRRLGGYATFYNEPDASGQAGRWYRENYAPPYDEWVVGHGHNSTDQFVADVNGDNRGPDAIAYYHSTGCWHAALTNIQSDRLSPPQEWICGHGIDSARRLMGDVTGEGRADAVVFRDTVGGQPAGRWDVATSQASRFAAPTQWNNDYHAFGSTDQFLADVNGDRKDDAVVFFAEDGCWSVALATPTGSYTGPATAATHFANWKQWICDYGIGSTTRMVGDVTGDPRADAVAFYDTYPTEGDYLSTATGYVSSSSGTLAGSVTYESRLVDSVDPDTHLLDDLRHEVSTITPGGGLLPSSIVHSDRTHDARYMADDTLPCLKSGPTTSGGQGAEARRINISRLYDQCRGNGSYMATDAVSMTLPSGYLWNLAANSTYTSQGGNVVRTISSDRRTMRITHKVYAWGADEDYAQGWAEGWDEADLVTSSMMGSLSAIAAGNYARWCDWETKTRRPPRGEIGTYFGRIRASCKRNNPPKMFFECEVQFWTPRHERKNVRVEPDKNACETQVRFYGVWFPDDGDIWTVWYDWWQTIYTIDGQRRKRWDSGCNQVRGRGRLDWEIEDEGRKRLHCWYTVHGRDNPLG